MIVVAAAFAADTVVYATGDPASHVARVAKMAEVPAGSLRAVSVGELLDGRAPIAIGGTVRPCQGSPTTVAMVRRSVELAEGGVAYMEYGSAKAALNAATRDLACLSEPADPALAARAWSLLGVIGAVSGEDGRPAFRQARVFAPDLAWDANFPPSARAAFDASAGGRTFPLSIVPEATGTLLDGMPPSGSVAEGAHLLQNDRATWTLDVTGPVTLLLPRAATPEILAWAGDGDLRDELAVLLTDALGTDGAAYVVTDNALWRVRLDTGAWDLVGTGVAPKRPSRAPLVVSGIASAVAGGGLIAGAFLSKPAFLADAAAGEYTQDEAESGALRLNVMGGIGYGLVGLGVALGGSALLIPTSDGVGVVWSGRW